MKQIIEVNGIKLYAYHGCLEEEAKIGGHYTVDVSITADLSKSFDSDNLNDTIDYVRVYEIVKEEMAIRSQLIEHVGNRIFQRISKEFQPILLKIKIRKHFPPIGGEVEDSVFILEGQFHSTKN